jgi:hypothetical protein
MIVADTPTEIAGKRFFDFGVCGMGIFIQKGPGGHDHSGSAKSALERRMVDKGLLQRIQRARLRIPQALNRYNGFAVAFDCENLAGIDSLAVHDDGAGAAGALAAGGFGSR